MATSLVNCVVSAPGKVILHGEHSVVHQRPALATSLNLRTTLNLSPAIIPDHVHVELVDLGISHSWPAGEIATAIAQLSDNFDCSKPENSSENLTAACEMLTPAAKENATSAKAAALPAFLSLFIRIACRDGVPCNTYTVKSSLPIGAGLGSSAAFSVCIAAGLLVGTQTIPANHMNWKATHRELVNSWAFQAEKVIHGNPSGIDNTVCTYGGVLRYQTGNFQPLENTPILDVVIVYTKVERSTRKLVASVQTRKDTFPTVMAHLLDSMETIAEEAQKLLVAMSLLQKDGKDTTEQFKQLSDLVTMNHHLLNAIGVGHPALDKVCSVGTERGHVVKLTGAGGGGCAMVLIAHPDPMLKDKMSLEGFDCWETTIGCPGVTVDTLALPQTS